MLQTGLTILYECEDEEAAAVVAVVDAMIAHMAISCAMSIAIVPDRAAVSILPRGTYMCL